MLKNNCNKETKKAHAAGIFDVRGCIGLRKNYGGYKVVEVRLVGIEKIWSVLDYLYKTHGGTVTNYSDSGDNPRKCWVITGQKAQKFLAEIEPYLKNVRRKKQASFIRRRYRVRRTGMYGLNKRDKEQRLRFQEEFVKI